MTENDQPEPEHEGTEPRSYADEIDEVLCATAHDDDAGDPVPFDKRTISFADWFADLTPRQLTRLGIVLKRLGNRSLYNLWHQTFALEPDHCNGLRERRIAKETPTPGSLGALLKAEEDAACASLVSVLKSKWKPV